MTTLIKPSMAKMLYVRQIDPRGLKTLQTVVVDGSELTCDFSDTTVVEVPVVETSARYSQVELRAYERPTPTNATRLTSNLNLDKLLASGVSYVIPAGYTYTGKITFSSGSKLFVEGQLVVGDAGVPQMVYATNEFTIQPGGQFSITGSTAFSPSNGTLYNYGSMITPLLSFTYYAKLVNKGTLTVNGSLSLSDPNNTFTNVGNASFGQFSVTNGTVVNNGVMTVDGLLYTNTAKLTNTNYLLAGRATTVRSTWYVQCGTYVTGVLMDESATLFDMKTGVVLTVGTFNASGSEVRMPSSAMMVAETVIFNANQSIISGTGSKYALCRFGSVIPGNGSYLVVNYKGRVEIECSNHYQGGIYSPFYAAEKGVRWAAEGHATTVIAPTSCNDDGNTVTPPYPTPTNPGFPLEVPTASVYTFIMEDNWPAVADYDMNDLVVKFSLAYVQNSSNLVESMKITYTLMAVGAKKSIAAAIQLDEILPSQVNTITYGGGLALTGKIFPRQAPGLESGQARVVVPLFDDAHKVLNSGIVINTMLNTYLTAQKFTPVTNTIDIAFKTAVDPSLVNVMKLNFFIVPDGIQNAQTRTEIHLSGFMPTDKADATRFGKYYDNSVKGPWYTTPGNLVWGILVPTSFKYPTETTSIVKAYPDFAAWCTSGGAQKTSWYLNPSTETGLIY